VGSRPLFILEKLQMNKLALAEKIDEIARKVVDKHNLELVRAEAVGSIKNPTVRVFIDKPNGISHEDCAAVSRDLSAVLDELDFISSAYLLEVSSPGLERELYSLTDFVKFTGNLAKVRTKMPIDGQRNFSGRIEAVDGEEIIFNDKTNGEVRFTFDQVAKANLEIDIEEEFRRGKVNG
jgi:ribosome maturation factor RimP